mmetsp:Transcript_24783/g.45834  ORF Transcript_24783/g.45834 Transcript_24783/m.45834 type:complete len:81 (+) Transcript_24783:77-319(+)
MGSCSPNTMGWGVLLTCTSQGLPLGLHHLCHPILMDRGQHRELTALLVGNIQYMAVVLMMRVDGAHVVELATCLHLRLIQ